MATKTRRNRGKRGSRPKAEVKEPTRGARGNGNPSVATDLPELSSLTDLPCLTDLRVSSEQREAYEQVCDRLAGEGIADNELRLGCVVRLDRGFPAVMCADGVMRAEFAARLTKGDSSRVAVGDWVCARAPRGHEMGLIQQILPRRSDLARWRGSNRGERQTLAANVDMVIAAQALGNSMPSSFERLARTAVVARDCGCELAVVLTKADRVEADELASAIVGVRDVLGDSTAIVASCAGHEAAEELAELREAALDAGARWGVDAVRELVVVRTVGIVLGESGAGKSTLLNALLGHEILATGAVRERDDRGRHTTVARRMVRLPDAGVLVDAPGLRSLPLVGHERGLALVFPELAEASRACRFRNCTHTHEPGCAIVEGLSQGRFTPVRARVYRALAAEMREHAAVLDADVVL